MPVEIVYYNLKGKKIKIKALITDISSTGDNKYMYKQYVGFKGHIFIVMDKACFSSAQMMLDEAQGNKRFIILGDEKSSGAGMYGTVCCNGDNCFMDPTHFILPKTKILCFMD